MSIGEINGVITVQKGDCAWNVAKQSLKLNGEKVTNAAIVKEMDRLAKLNGCDDVQDFSKKFFSTIGKNIETKDLNAKKRQLQRIQEVSEEPKRQKAKNEVVTQTDTTRKAAKREVVVQVDSTKTLVKSDSLPKLNTLAPADTTKPVKKFEAITTSEEVAKVQGKVENPIPKNTKKFLGLASMDREFGNHLKNPIPAWVFPHPENTTYLMAINSMDSDEARIIQYNKDNYKGEYYGIIDKKTCKLKIYCKDGTFINDCTVGIGKLKGDNLPSYYYDKMEHTKNAAKAELGRYTTAGEFTLDEYSTPASNSYVGADGVTRVMALKGDNRGVRSGQMSIHMLYKPDFAKRKAAIDSPSLEDNRMSYGCVNLTPEDYDRMHFFLGEGYKIYVLPEEDGNKLQLEKQKDNSYKFVQQYHKDAKRMGTPELASYVEYDVRKDRTPENYVDWSTLCKNT